MAKKKKSKSKTSEYTKMLKSLSKSRKKTEKKIYGQSQKLKSLKKREKEKKEKFIKEGSTKKEYTSLMKQLDKIQKKKLQAQLERGKQTAKLVGTGALMAGAKISQVSERVEGAIGSALSKPLLKKPSVELIKPISSQRLFQQFAGAGFTMFKRQTLPEQFRMDYSKEPNFNAMKQDRNLFFRPTQQKLSYKQLYEYMKKRGLVK